jgi:hypothetical protein
MPGLLRGLARTALVAGTATAVSNRVSRRQYGRWAEQEQAQYIPPQQSAVDNEADLKLAQLRELADLKHRGILTDEEFAQQKQWILNS